MSIVTFGPSPAAASQATAPTALTLRFIDPPEFSQVLQRWVWDGLEVRPVRFGSVLGHGLFATRVIEPGLMIPYVGDLFTEEGEARRAANKVPPSRYILEEFDADPGAPACKQLYCAAGFANEAYADRRYNSTFVTFNGYEDADRTICKNMPFYRHFDAWGGFLVPYKRLAVGEELCSWYGKSYASMRDYTPLPFVPDADYKALVNVENDLKVNPRPLPVTYAVGQQLPQRRPRDDADWDFRALFMVNGKSRWYRGKVVGLNGAWVKTEFEDGEMKAYRKSDFHDNPHIQWMSTTSAPPV